MNIISGPTQRFALLMVCFGCAAPADDRPGDVPLPGDRRLAPDRELLQAEVGDYLRQEQVEVSFFRKLVRDPATGFVYALTNAGDVLAMRADGSPARVFRVLGQGPGEAANPVDMQWHGGRLYVLDLGRNKVVVFDTLGRAVRDVRIRDVPLLAFVPDALGNLIVPRLPLAPGPLFFVFDQTGSPVDSIGSQGILDEDAAIPARPLMGRAPGGRLLLAFKITGQAYLLEADGRLVRAFSVRGGPEWRQSEAREAEIARYEKQRRSWPWHIEQIATDPSGRVYISWGGNFGDERSVLMRFDAAGAFLGRVYGNAPFLEPPVAFAVESDSVLWLHSSQARALGRAVLRLP